MRATAIGAVAAVALSGGAAAAGEWEDLFTPPLFTDNPIPMMFGVDCVAQGHCFVAGGTPNTGMSVYRISDEYFRDTQRLKVNTPIPLTMLLSMAMKDDKHGVAAGLGLGVGGTYWSIDGENFNSSLQVGIVTSQDVQRLPSKGWSRSGYAFVGQVNGNQGPAVSHTGGVTFKGHWWPKDLAPEAPARYGAFPSEQTWYVTGGTWPSNDDSDAEAAQYKYVSERVRVHRKTGRAEIVDTQQLRRGAGDSASYTGVITKTADGGQTWEVAFNATGKYYFNGIDCASETVCVAVGEASADAPGASPGAHVLMTTDGKTWSEVYSFGADASGSALSVKMVSETEAWVAASWQKSLLQRGGVMLHTVDGGKTWEQGETLTGIGAMTAMTFIDGTHAYAVGVTFAQVSTVICMGCGKPPAPAPGTGSFEQIQCSDANCSTGCRTGSFAQGQCLATQSGGSANVTCSADGSTLVTEIYSSSDCSGDAKKESEPTKQCLKSSSGGYFENICPPNGGVSGAAAGAALWRRA